MFCKFLKNVLKLNNFQDDVGSALLCYSVDYSSYFHVGIFQSLVFYEGTKLDQNSIRMCYSATDMEFSLINEDEELIKAIEKQGIAEFDMVYRECEYH